MKKLNKYIYGAIGALVLSLSATSCSPDDYEALDESKLPVAAGTTVTVDVDQTTNQVTFNMEGDGIYPVWIMTWENTNPYSTTNGLTKIVNSAGDYVLNYRVGNRHGISQGMGTATFHIDNSLVNFDMYTSLLGGGRTWRIAASEAAHMACGEPGTDGTGWWSASPNEKEANGIYDDRITFDASGTYTYSPGEDGLMFVNTGCTTIAGNPNDGNDFDAVAEEQTTTYELVGEGENVYLVLPAGTNFPYISTDDQYANPRFRIESITGSRLVLIYDNGNIAWHFILTSAEESTAFDGFDPNSDCNMFKTCNYDISYWYAPGWSQIADPELSTNGNAMTWTLPEATTDQWQAQVLMTTDMATNTVNNYDFSCKLTASADHPGVTVKLTKSDDDNVFYFAERIPLKAYEETLFYMSDMPGIDMESVKLVLDFGGNAAASTVTVSDIVLKEHSCDDGRTPPAEDEGEQDGTEYIYDAETNLWKTHVDDGDNYSTFFFYAPGWTEIAAPAFTGTGGVYTVALPEATFAQWQAQVHIISDIPGEADTPYDFSCTLLADQTCPGVTVKLTQDGDDNNFFFTERVDLNPYEEYVLKVPAATLPVGAAPTLKLVLDFGGNPANTNVTVNNIVLQKTVQ